MQQNKKKKLWQYLRKSQLNYKFRRQQPIGGYIVDFMCPELRLIIELDGGQHNQSENMEYDRKRDTFLQSEGFKILRYWNNDIDNNIEGVIQHIKQVISTITPPPTPLPQGAGDASPQGEGMPNVRFELCTADKLTEKYDFVCANILHNVLAEIMGDLKNIMKDGGLMSLSGILQEKKPIVLEAIRRESLTIVDTITQDQWISFVVKK